MNITINLPQQVELAYVAEAKARGVPIDTLVREMPITRQPTGLTSINPASQSVFEQGLGLFGSTEDAALLDEAVSIAYEERRRSTNPATAI